MLNTSQCDHVIEAEIELTRDLNAGRQVAKSELNRSAILCYSLNGDEADMDGIKIWQASNIP